MNLGYNSLFKLLTDKNINKADLPIAIGISSKILNKLSDKEDSAKVFPTFAKVYNNTYVSIGAPMEIFNVIDGDFWDIMEVISRKREV